MPNPNTQLLPNVVQTPNVPNTGTGVLIAGANPQRDGLLVWNISANIIWFGGPSVTFVSGTQQVGTFALAAGAWAYFGGMFQDKDVIGFIPPMFQWVWTQSLFAQAAAGATNAVTVYEF